MKDKIYNAATVAARLTGFMEAMRNICIDMKEYRKAAQINDMIIRAYEGNTWSDSSERWLEDYKHEAIKLHETIRTQTNP